MIWITNHEKGKPHDFPEEEVLIGEPVENETFTSEQMKEMGLVGIFVTYEHARQCVLNQMMIKKFYI